MSRPASSSEPLSSGSTTMTTPQDIERLSSSDNEPLPAEPNEGDNYLVSTRSKDQEYEDINNPHNPLEKSQSTRSLADNMSLLQEVMFVTVICQAQLLTQAGLGQVLAIVYSIGEYYSLADSELSWLVAGYSLTVGTFILISGRIGDLFGHKPVFMFGFAWFAVWSMVAGLAAYSNHVLFVFARVLQGIGPAIILPTGLAIFGMTYAPGRKKSMVFALFGACAPTGSILGSAFAALFDLTWWPWAFFALAIACAVVGVVAYWAIPDQRHNHRRDQSWRETFEALDPWGALTGVLSLVLFNFAWNQAPLVGWSAPYVIVCLILGVLLVPVFFWVELRVSKSPLIPFDCLTVDVAYVLAAVACGWATFGIWSYYIWSFLLNLRGTSPLLATAYISPVVVSGGIAAITTGFLLGHMRPAWILTLSLTAFTVGTILIMTAPVQQNYWAQIFVSSVITPWGMDMSFPAGTLIVSNAVAKKHQGIGASLIATVVNYSISLGLGFAGTVEVNIVDGGTTPADTLKGYRSAFYMGTGLSGLGVLICLVFLARSYTKGPAPSACPPERVEREEREEKEEHEERTRREKENGLDV